VLIRPRYHRLALLIGFIDLLIGLVMLRKESPFLSEMGWLDVGIGTLVLVTWLGTVTTLKGGLLEKRVLFVPWKKLSVDEISRVAPHPKNGKWGYGTCLIVITKSGQSLSLQPNHPAPFLSLLRNLAPAAEFQI
jgi:hypothetical protein